jgi:crotonobetainyl-CoA:carnitine CoA-transferase CaiB-like acyl-CoA transferase
MPGPLAGLRILELGTQTPGKQCTCMLGDLGAEVIRIERPGSAGPLSDEDLVLNRNKRSVMLDLRRGEAREAVLRLCATVDALLEGYRPGVAARLGLGYDAVHAVNPRLVYCSLTSFGLDGPLATLPAFDIVTQARAGLLRLPEGKDRPRTPSLYLADICGSLMAAIGILVALSARERSGEGQYVDVSMLDGLLWWFAGLLGPQALTGKNPRSFDDHPGYATYETSEGRWLALGVFRPQSWATLCGLLGHPAFVSSFGEKPETLAPIREAFAARLRTRPLSEWLALFAENDVEAGPCNTLVEAFESEHARVRAMVLSIVDTSGRASRQVGQPLKFSGRRLEPPRPAPLPGQDTRGVLGDLGYSDSEIASITGP